MADLGKNKTRLVDDEIVRTVKKIHKWFPAAHLLFWICFNLLEKPDILLIV